MAKVDAVEPEKNWRAESDARTLRDANVIKGDPKRFRLAVRKAKKMSEESMDEAKAMKKVSNLKVRKKT